MSFEHHAFISYAHLDDRPLSEAQKGWVTRFHTTFEALLGMRLGEKARVWRDDKLRGNDVFAPEIVAQFPRTALLISILTPRYVQSEWCRREVETFCAQAQGSGGVNVENQSRVLKVLKSPVEDRKALPAVMRDTLGYTFFAVEDGVPIELDGVYGEQYASDYNRRVCKLAWDAAQLLRRLQAAPDGAPGADAVSAHAVPRPQEGQTAPCVFVAFTGTDLCAEREHLVGEIQQQGFRVVPEGALPLDDPQVCMARLEAAAQRADLAVQIVGARPGPTPDGADQPLIALQQRVLLERHARRPLPRVIWLPDSIRTSIASHQGFVDSLRTQADQQAGAELVFGGFAQLSAAVQEALTALRSERAGTTTPSTATGSGSRLVYLVGTQADRRASLPLRKSILDAGWDVAWPAFEGDAASLRSAHDAQLQACDALVVFYGEGNDTWKRSIDWDTRKALALRGRRVPIWTVVAAPFTDDKEDLLELDAARVLRLNADAAASCAQHLLDRLSADLAGGAASPLLPPSSTGEAA